MDTIKFIDSTGKSRRGVQRTCPVCQKIFVTRKDKLHETCGKICKGKLHNQRNSKFVKCAQCGKEYNRANSKLKLSKSGFYFCCRKCKDEAQRIGGIKAIMPTHYGTSNGREYWKKLIEKTPNPCCAGCGINKRYLLGIHHIDGNNCNNDSKNFEIVCGNCHKIRHLKQKGNGEWIYCTTHLTPRDLLFSFV